MNVDDLTVNISHLSQRELLSDWRWLIDKSKVAFMSWISGPSKLPILVTAAGDVFVQDRFTKSVHFLDVTQGSLSLAASSLDEFKELLKDRQFVERYFSVEMINALRKVGLSLTGKQIFSYKVPPVLGGEFEVENIEATDISVHFSIAGQIHRQVANLPVGTPINRIRLR